MPTTTAKVSASNEANALHHIPYPIWDPIPDWIKFDEQRLHDFGQFQIQAKLKELELTKEKLVQLQKLTSK